MKTPSVIVAVIAGIALVGDIIFMLALASLGEAASAFTELSGTELGAPELQELGQTFSLAVNMGWLWAILVLVTCLFAIKFAVLDSRKK